MSALEQEIMEKFRLLDKDAKQRIRQALEQEDVNPNLPANISPPKISLGEWLEKAQILREEMEAKYGTLTYSIADLKREMNEERLNDLMDRY